jgi:hypothetical protein
LRQTKVGLNNLSEAKTGKMILENTNSLIQLILLFILISTSSCNRKMGGAIPVYMDEYVSTTEQRRFQLNQIMYGQIIDYQKSYDCNNDSIIYNATAIIKVGNQFFTIYQPCLNTEFAEGDEVVIRPLKLSEKEYTTREIYKPFPKNSENYPYWECKSCKYKNTYGQIKLTDE